MGLMHTENIAITAEAYDVAMDISFPRGTCIYTCHPYDLHVYNDMHNVLYMYVSCRS